MRLIPLILLVVCCSASAEWAIVTWSDKALFYVDTDTIRRQGTIRRFWALKNFLVRDEDGILSIRGFEEHDCKEEKMRVLEISTHFDLWASGGVKDNFSLEDKTWKRIPPGTIVEGVHKFVCKK